MIDDIYLLLRREQPLNVQHHMFLLCNSQLTLVEAAEQEAPLVLCMSGAFRQNSAKQRGEQIKEKMK